MQCYARQSLISDKYHCISDWRLVCACMLVVVDAKSSHTTVTATVHGVHVGIHPDND